MRGAPPPDPLTPAGLFDAPVAATHVSVRAVLHRYYEDMDPDAIIDSDAFILRTLDHWEFGADNTGDIQSSANILALRDCGRRAHLVTADGSIDCSTNPREQEAMVAHLHFCEAVAALHVLAVGGHFVLKMFTFFETASVHLVFLLTCAFDKVMAP